MSEHDVNAAKVQMLQSATRLLQSLRKLAEAVRVSVERDTKRGH